MCHSIRAALSPTMCDQVELCKNNRSGIAGILFHHSDIKWASQFNNISELKLARGERLTVWSTRMLHIQGKPEERNVVIHADKL